MATSPEIRLSGPLQTDSKKYRRNLLATTIATIAVVDLGLVPQKLSILDIDFSKTEQETLLFILGALIAYFMAAFLIYAVPDFVGWRGRIRWTEHELYERVVENVRNQKKAELDYWKAAWGNESTQAAIKVLSDLKAIFDFLIPFPLVVYAYARLARYDFSLTGIVSLTAIFLFPAFIYFALRIKRQLRRIRRQR